MCPNFFANSWQDTETKSFFEIKKLSKTFLKAELSSNRIVRGLADRVAKSERYCLANSEPDEVSGYLEELDNTNGLQNNVE